MDIATQQKKAAGKFSEVGMPSVKEESWRFTDVSHIQFDDFHNEWTDSKLPYEPLSDLFIVFENGRISNEKSSFGSLPNGIKIHSIHDSQDERIGSLADSESGFVLHNTANFDDGIFIDVDVNVSIEKPIHIIHLADSENGCFQYRHLFSLKENARVSIVEEYIGSTDTLYLTNSVSEVFLEDKATLDHYKIQRESTKAYHFQTIESKLGYNSVFSNHSISVGSKLGRNDIRSRIQGEDSEAICNGLYLLKDDQFYDTHLFMDHAVPKCQSHQLHKGILADKSKAVFCGRILVQQDAQETDAIQSNGNLLLSRNAKVNTMPQLEIYADDVKCTHGATIGELDEEALFYLQSRGIDPNNANSIMIYAFANEVLDEVMCSVLKPRIEFLIQEWLAGVTQ